MTVSVRMNRLLELEIERAAARLGITKSQFIISAVEQALGRKSPASIYHQVMEESAHYASGSPSPSPSHDDPAADATPTTPPAKILKSAHERQQDDYAAWLALREARQKEQP